MRTIARVSSNLVPDRGLMGTREEEGLTRTTLAAAYAATQFNAKINDVKKQIGPKKKA